MSRSFAAVGGVLGVLALAVVLRVTMPGPSGAEAGAGSDAGVVGTESGRPAGLPAGVEPARVVRHVDGDTLRLVGRAGDALLPGDEDVAVRLLEIDTPETGRAGSARECFADEAARALAALAPVGSEVWVERDRDLHDPYDRVLLYLWTADGELVNLAMVRDGYARAVLYEPNDRYIERMRAAESAARAAGRGMWGACR